MVEISASGGVPPFTYYLSDGSVFTSGQLTDLYAGYYQVEVRDSNGCPAKTDFYIEAKDEIKVEVNDIINADCTGSKGGSIQLSISGGTEPYTYIWSNGLTTPEPEDLPAGIHEVTITDLNNCEYKKSFVIDYEELTDVPSMNTSFSPNGDGINDLWVIKNLEYYPDNQLVVINRWGNEVLTVNNYKNDWNGSQLAEGTYFYILKVKMCEDYRTFDGYVTILR